MGHGMPSEHSNAPEAFWSITHPGGSNVRESANPDAQVLGVKPCQAIIRGTLEGEWLKLNDEPGYIMMRRNGKEFVRPAPEARSAAEEAQRKAEADEERKR